MRRRSSEPRRPAALPHSQKFLAATAALIGVAIGALGIAVLLLASGGGADSSAKWSTWSPPDGGVAGEREIANAVAPFYRAAPATQLVVVTAQNIADPGASSAGNSSGSSGSGGGSSGSGGSGGSTEVALRDPGTGSLGALGGTTALYNLCGLGPNCSVSSGAPSLARLLLLRREALELALYTFKYISGVQNVVAILPPGHTAANDQLTLKPPPPGHTSSPSANPVDIAVLFERRDLQHYLQQPLRAILPEPVPPSVDEMPSAPEAELVSVITGQTLFQQQTVQSQTGNNVLVLNPLPPQ